jgi:endonuclease III
MTATAMKSELAIGKFNQLLKTHAATPPKTPTDLVELLVESFMMADATDEQGRNAFDKLMRGSVDVNDLRAALVKEQVGMIGVRYPLAWDRCALMRRTLMDLYKREHKVSLERLRNVSKREAKTYVEGLAGITPFVASRTLLLGLGIHGVPVDQATVDVLVEAEVLAEASDPVEVAALLSRHVLADDAVSAHAALRKATDRFLASGRVPRLGKKKK